MKIIALFLVYVVGIIRATDDVIHCACNTNDCIESNNCSFNSSDTSDSKCQIVVHLEAEKPNKITQKCVKTHDSLGECTTTFVVDELLHCCTDNFCNSCPTKTMISEIADQYLDDLYNLLPSCRPNITNNVNSSFTHIPVPTPLSHVSPTQASSSKSTVNAAPTTQPPTDDLQNSETERYLVILLVVTAFLGIFVISSIISFLIIYMFIKKRLKLRRVRAVPYNSALAVADFGVDSSQSCSSNALVESRLLVSRTLGDDIKIIKKLGQGKFGSVFLGRRWDQDNIAIKIYNTVHELEWEREKDIYSTYMLTHPNILKFITSDRREMIGRTEAGHCIGDGVSLWTYLEYHPNGNLQEYLKAKRNLSIAEAYILTTTFLDGLHFLHRSVNAGSSTKPGIAHRDIKSPNILIKSDFTSCIGDLGLAVKQHNDTGVDIVPQNKLSGTRRYLAPEILNKTMKYDKFISYVYADIYAAALVIWEVFQCIFDEYKLPFHEHASRDPTVEEVKKIVNMGCRPSVMMFENNENLKFLCTILHEGWNDSTSARPTALNINKKLKQSAIKQN